MMSAIEAHPEEYYEDHVLKLKEVLYYLSLELSEFLIYSDTMDKKMEKKLSKIKENVSSIVASIEEKFSEE